MNIRELKQAHASNIKWFKALDDKLEKENRTQNSDEKLEYEKRFTETEKLKERIETAERHKHLFLEKSGLENEISPREKRKYSVTNAIKVITNEAKGGSYEKECSQELEKRTKSTQGGFLVPTKEIFGKTTFPEREKRIVDNQPAIVDDPLRPELTLLGLYENSIMDQLRVTKISAEGTFNFPTGDSVSAGWFSGTGGSASTDKMTEDDVTFTSTEVSARFLGVATGWSLKMLKEMSGSLSLENLLRRSLAMGMAEKLDDAMINGTNANSQPRGLFNFLGNDNRTQIALKKTSPIRKWVWSDITEEKKQLRTQFKNNAMNPQWLMSPTTEKELSDEQRFSGTSGQSILEAIKMPVVSGHCPDLKVVLGDFSQLLAVSYQSIELKLGLVNDDLFRGTTRLVGIGCFQFSYWRKEGFRQIVLTRA